jgi:general secretion pathway protein H
MRTSAPGTCDARVGPARARAGGFTLVEIIVVLAILGVLAGLIGAIARPDESGLVRFEAERLARLIDLAAAESGLTGKAIGWSAEAHGYRFWRFREDTGWSEIRDSDLLRARTLPEGMVISGLRVEDAGAGTAARLVLAPYAARPAFVIELALGAARYGVAGEPLAPTRAVPIDKTSL